MARWIVCGGMAALSGYGVYAEAAAGHAWWAIASAAAVPGWLLLGGWR